MNSDRQQRLIENLAAQIRAYPSYGWSEHLLRAVAMMIAVESGHPLLVQVPEDGRPNLAVVK